MFQKQDIMAFVFVKQKYNHSFAQMNLMIETVHGSLSNRYKHDIAKETNFYIIFVYVGKVSLSFFFFDEIGFFIAANRFSFDFSCVTLIWNTLNIIELTETMNCHV